MALDGILLIDKERGWTSHDVVAKARSITGQRRIGHTGTLDPMATGLLVLCLGHATRLVEYMIGHPKRYQGEITLGVATSTDDAEGEVLATRNPPELDQAALVALETRFSGEIRQRPPAFSAVKVRGERAYAAARKGNPLMIPERNVIVHDLALDAVKPGVLAVTIDCSAGTYVRSIARDIGQALGCGGHLSSLRRISAGVFRVEAAVGLHRLALAIADETVADILHAPDEGIVTHDAAIISVERGERLRHGTEIASIGQAKHAAQAARIYTADGTLIAIANVDLSGQIRPVKVLSP